MLVLTRKTKQQICIGDNVKITILMVKGQTVRVGIEAPDHVRVLRAELPVFGDAPVVAEAATEPPLAGRRSSRRMGRDLTTNSESPAARRSQRLDTPDMPRSERRSRLPGASDASMLCNPQRLGSGPLSAMVARRS